jgi:hypothetical protein
LSFHFTFHFILLITIHYSLTLSFIVFTSTHNHTAPPRPANEPSTTTPLHPIQSQTFFQCISFFIPWGILSPQLEDAIVDQLHLRPLSIPILPVVKGRRGALSIILPRPDLPEFEASQQDAFQLKRDSTMSTILRYITSESLSAIHLFVSALLCKKMGSFLPQKALCSSLLNSIVFLIRTQIQNFLDPSLMLLAEVWAFFFFFFVNCRDVYVNVYVNM